MSLLSTMTLLDQAKDGSEDARETLYRRYLPRLRRWARGRLDGRARGLLATDDIVQDVLVRTLHRVDEFDPKHSGAFLAYMRLSLKNRLMEAARHAQWQSVPEPIDTEVPASDPSPFRNALENELVARFDQALERLTAVEQAAVVARLELGMSYDEIARELGKPSPDAARMTVNRAVARLSQEMAALKHARA